ncbi:MAG: prolyl oligopeptidase family serine peptidase, partial [Spirochaetales bacterium]|nr:prolyl oligopeptidase family serine peptidase [Spirochaetales bacterium]
MNKLLITLFLFLSIPLFSQNLYDAKDYIFYVDGIKEYALLSTPKIAKPMNGFPIIIIIHGHVPEEIYSTENSYKGIFRTYASSEFVVVKPDLMGHGRSEKSREYNSLVNKLLFPKDIIALIESLDFDNFIDKNNIFIMGHSNGGETTLRILTSYPNLINGASLWAPVSVKLEESNFYYRGSGRRMFGLEALDNPESKKFIDEELIKLKDPIINLGFPNLDSVRYLNKLGNILSPIIIRHGDNDKSVPLSWSLKLVDEIKNQNSKIEVTLVKYPGDDHNLAKNQRSALLADLDWF